MNLQEIAEKHEKWVEDKEGGEKVDLSGADLSWTNLSRANLSLADLSGADGKFYLAFFGQHHAVAAGEHISIVCERHTIKHWVENYKEIGKKRNYSKSEIEMYGTWIKIVAKNLNNDTL